MYITFKKLILLIIKKIIILIPSKHENVYRLLKNIYQLLPMPLETKRRLADYVLLHNKSLYETRVTIYDDKVIDFYSFPKEKINQPLKPPCKRILIVEQRLPTPDKTSGSLRLYSIIELLIERGWEITFTSNTKPNGYHWILKNIDQEIIKYEKLLEQYKILVIYGIEELSSHLQTEGMTYMLTILSYPEIMHQYAPLIRASMPNSTLIYDAIDLHGLRFYREALIKNNHPKLIQKAEFYNSLENSIFDYSDLIIAITENECREILHRNPEACVTVIPNIHTTADNISPPDDREGLLFIGHYLHSPNEDAMIYFVSEILPMIHRYIGEVPLYMLGSSITAKISALTSNSIHAVGYVEDPVPWFNKSKVFVAPLRYGAGMKGKIGQSLGLGLPIVTTSIGSEGMKLRTEQHVLIADNPDSFAANVSRLYTNKDLWQKLSVNGRSHVDKHFSKYAVGQSIDQLIAMTNISI